MGAKEAEAAWARQVSARFGGISLQLEALWFYVAAQRETVDELAMLDVERLDAFGDGDLRRVENIGRGKRLGHEMFHPQVKPKPTRMPHEERAQDGALSRMCSSRPPVRKASVKRCARRRSRARPNETLAGRPTYQLAEPPRTDSSA